MERRSMARPGVALALLLAVYVFNFLDRQILAILAQPVKADLGLSDAQMGALGGLAFALFYATMAIPLALIADRKGRSGVIAASLAVWSLFTALCGMVGSYAQLFFCRLGVGIGEAGGVAPSYALISDYFSPERRARALAIYSLGIPLGTAGGALFGAAIAAAVDWRTAFIVLGIAGNLLAVPFRIIVSDPPPAARGSTAGGRPALAVFGALARQPVFWLLSLGAGSGSLAGYGLGFWTPSLLQRSFGLTLIETGQFLGLNLLLTGTVGVLLGGVLADRLGRADRAAYGRLPAVAYLICAPLFAATFLSHSATTAFLLLLIPSGLSYLWLAPVTTAVQHLVEPADRATASACFLLINNGIGLSLGALTIGKLSDRLTAEHGPDGLRYAMCAVLLSYLVAAAFMLIAAPRLRTAWRG